MKNRKNIRKFGCLVLALAMAVSTMTGCGKKGDADANNQNAQGAVSTAKDSGLTFDTKFYTVSDSEKIYNNFVAFQGDLAYMLRSDATTDDYKQSLVSYDYKTGSSETIDLDTKIDGNPGYFEAIAINKDGKIAAFIEGGVDVPNYEEGEEAAEVNPEDLKYVLRTYDASGNIVIDEDITNIIKEEYADSYIYDCVYTSNDYIVAVVDTDLVVFDEKGQSKGTISTNYDYVISIFEDNDKNIVVGGEKGISFESATVNLTSLSMGQKMSGYPIALQGSPVSDKDGNIYVATEGNLVKYDPKDQSQTNMFSWTDTGILMANLYGIGFSEDGHFLLFLMDFTNYKTEIVEVFEVDPSTVQEKQVITLGTLIEMPGSLSNAVVNFNKQSDKYKIKVVSYASLTDLIGAEDQNTAVYDAIGRMNNSFLDEGCPDIIDLSYSNVESLAGKGLLMDLNDYLNTSNVMSKNDIVPGIVEAFTVDGKLIAIPRSFYINVLFAKADLLQGRESWTVKEFIDFCNQYPDATPFEYATQQDILYTMLALAADKYIDYKNLTCDFDNQDFIDILDFAKTFPKEVDYNVINVMNTDPNKFINNEVLFNEATLWSMESYAIYSSQIGAPAEMIGYPTADGSSGFTFNVDGNFGISTKTQYKEGVYEFLDFYFEQPSESYGQVYFSSKQSELDKQLKDSMEEKYVLDENGEQVLDENGEPMKEPFLTTMINNEIVDIYAAKPEEVEQVRNAINNTHTAISQDVTIYNMIYEEAQPYFEGQKSAEETAKVIQSKISIYISEQD